MICPHCNQNILYKERSGQKCSKCGREFAFEPKTDQLGLHDVRFRKAADKLSENGKLYFTSGQLLHFLSRKKIKNSFSIIRGLLVFVSVAVVVAIIVAGIVSKIFALFFLAFLVALLFAGVLSTFWKNEGTLSLPQNPVNFENTVLARWKWIYQKLPEHLIGKHLPLQNSPAKIRGVLVCPETEVLECLEANGAVENLGLLLFNPYLAGDKFDFIRAQRDLPLFLLHDASPEGCALKSEFIKTHLDNDRSRLIYDLGLRPQTSIKSNLMRLRTQARKDLPQGLNEQLISDEIAWLAKGNYTPLLALRPAQLIKFVTRGVNSRLQYLSKTSQRNSAENDQKAAQTVGFMTWVGK